MGYLSNFMKFVGIRITFFTNCTPPKSNTIYGKLACVITLSNVNKSIIVANIIFANFALEFLIIQNSLNCKFPVASW
jgi:hypothetical protein